MRLVVTLECLKDKRSASQPCTLTGRFASADLGLYGLLGMLCFREVLLQVAVNLG